MKNIIAVAIAVCLSLGFMHAQDGSGIISALKGNAEKRSATTEDWLSAQLKTNVASKELVRTLPDSFAEISLTRGTVIRLAPKTTVNMVKLYEESKDKVVTNIQVESGEVWGNVNKQSEDDVFNVDSTSVSSSIVGTIFRINSADDGSTLVKVYKGNVEVSSNVQKKEQKKPDTSAPTEISGPSEVEGPKEVTLEQWTVIVREMMQIRVDKNGNIVRMDPIDPKAADEQNAWVQWNQELDAKSTIKH